MVTLSRNRGLSRSHSRSVAQCPWCLRPRRVAAPKCCQRHVECLDQREGVLAAALLAWNQAVAVAFILHLALAVVVGEAHIVVGRQKQTGALSFQPLGDRGISSGAASCSESRGSRPNTISVSVSATPDIVQATANAPSQPAPVPNAFGDGGRNERRSSEARSPCETDRLTRTPATVLNVVLFWDRRRRALKRRSINTVLRVTLL